MSKIMVIDDDVKLSTLIKDFLEPHKYQVICYNNPVVALKKIKPTKPDLIILDIMMPEMDGFQVLRKVRELLQTPVIMLTARGEVSDRIVGLELGADDYLSKPFEPRELLARIQSVFRRTQSPGQLVDTLLFDNLSINKLKQEVVLGGESVVLSTTEYEALLLFAENPGRELDRDFLVENLRGIRWQSYDRSIDVLVSRLRLKLGDTPAKTNYIKTVHGVGYMFIGEPKNKK
ncbi:MAG: DNA-binding response regulator [Candidatus Marinimicrobia bacterium]|nr:DNA-binding response regulator [Candidatus Neomarinimicrobiota bacterium]|tara:strand:- start:320 stop:1015 length:696 start_codon:yes stop_codon:yes gene_type:complete